MRKILRWAESANIQEERGNKIKRWKRGSELIRNSNPRKWLGQVIEEIIDIRELEIKAALRVDSLSEQETLSTKRKERLIKNWKQ